MLEKKHNENHDFFKELYSVTLMDYNMNNLSLTRIE